MIFGATLLRWVILRLGGPDWVAFWAGLTLALFVMASGPIRIG